MAVCGTIEAGFGRSDGADLGRAVKVNGLCLPAGLASRVLCLQCCSFLYYISCNI